MTELDVRPVEEYELDSWDKFVSEGPSGTLYHSSTWRSVINTGYSDGDYKLIGAFDSQGLAGGFCALTRRRLGVETAVTPLCTPYTGFILKAYEGTKSSDAMAYEGAVAQALAGFLRKYRYQHVQCAPGLSDFRALTDAGYKLTPRATLEINLKLPEDELFASFDGNVRRNIRKAQKVGFEITDQWDRESAYKIFSNTFLRHGQPCPVPEKLFQEISDGQYLVDHRRRYCAWQNGQLQSFLVALRHDGRVYYELAGTDYDALKSGVSSLLTWEMLRDHLSGGWDVFDFVGANTRTISRFKEGFNPALRMHLQAEYCSSRRIGIGRGIRQFLRKRR